MCNISGLLKYFQKIKREKCKTENMKFSGLKVRYVSAMLSPIMLKFGEAHDNNGKA